MSTRTTKQAAAKTPKTDEKSEATGMDEVWIEGGRKLKGQVAVSGSKNATLPILTATLLAPGIYRFTNVPNLRDISTMLELLTLFGVRSRRDDEHALLVDSTNSHNADAPYELVKTMRASSTFWVRFSRGSARRVSPCPAAARGARAPWTSTSAGSQRLGADVEIEHGYIVAKSGKLKGGVISFEISSVGATGEHPDGGRGRGGGDRDRERGVRARDRSARAVPGLDRGRDRRHRHLAAHRQGLDPPPSRRRAMIPDRIEAGTFLAAAAITGGDVEATCVDPAQLGAVLGKLEEAGAEVIISDRGVRVLAPERPRPVRVATAPYPGFPTDMQAQFMALLSVASGTSTITDTIYTDRFTHVAELQRLGADIRVEGNTAIVHGVPTLSGAQVMATDLRASAALILAGLVAEKETRVSRVYHLDRGYEWIEEKLQGLGAAIRRVRA